MSTIGLYQVLKKIPGVSDEEAKQAVAAAEQSDRLRKIEADIAELNVSSRIILALQLLTLAILVVTLFQ